MSERIQNLRLANETMHDCTASHAASEPVIEVLNGQLAWDGVVEAFDIHWHPKAKSCYAISYEYGRKAQCVTVLEIPRVDSAQTAVKVAIAAKSKASK